MKLDFLTLPDGRLVTLTASKLLRFTPGAPPPPPPEPTTALTLDDYVTAHPLAYPVDSRKPGTENDPDGGHASSWFLFDYAGGLPADLQCRVIDKDSGQAIPGSDWAQALSIVSIAAGKGAARVPYIRIGTNYQLQIRVGSNHALFSNGQQVWGVGPTWGHFGQSNAAGMLQAGGAFDAVAGFAGNEVQYFMTKKSSFAGTSGTVATGGTGTAGATDTGSNASPSQGGSLSFLRMASKAFSEKYGREIPVKLVMYAVSNNGIDTFLPGGANYSEIFGNSGTTAGDIGFGSPFNFLLYDIEGAGLHIGESNQGDTAAQFQAKLLQFYNGILSVIGPRSGRTAQNFHFRPAVLGVYGNLPSVVGKRKAVRDFQAYAQANNLPKIRSGFSCIDCDPRIGPRASGDPVDGLHFDDITGGIQHRRLAIKRATHDALHAWGLAPYSAQGPHIASITRGAGLTANVTFQHEGGTQIVARNPAQAVTGFKAVRPSDGVTPITVTYDAAAQRLTFSELPARVTYCVEADADVSNPLYDDAIYPFVPDANGNNLFGAPAASLNEAKDVYRGFPVNETQIAFEVA